MKKEQALAPTRGKTLIVAAAMFMLLLDGTILNTALPGVAAGLGVEALSLSATVTVYLLAGAAVLPLASWLGDRVGQRSTFLGAVLVFTAASILCGAAQDATQLVIARALQGLGGGLMLPAGRTLALAGARREDILGITALLTWPALFAPVVGPPLGGIITTYFSWRWIFFINLPLGVLALVLIMRYIPAGGRPRPRAFDGRGAVGAALGLILVLGGLELLSQVIRSSANWMAALLAVAAGVGILAWTAFHLRAAPDPLVSLAPFQQKTFAVTVATGGAIATLCLQSMPFLLPLFFQLGLGRSALDAGALLLPYTLGNLAMKSVTTPILLRFGFRNVLLATTLVNAVAIAMFALVGTKTALPPLVALLIFAGCARSMLLTAIHSLMFTDVPPTQRGAASTLFTVSMQVTGALGVAVAAIGLALHASDGAQPLPQTGFAATFMAFAVLSLAAILPFRGLPADAGAELGPTRKA